MSHNISVNIESIPLGRKVRFLELKTGIWSNLQDLTFGTGLIHLLTINKQIKRIFKGTVEIFYIDPLFIECHVNGLNKKKYAVRSLLLFLI